MPRPRLLALSGSVRTASFTPATLTERIDSGALTA